MRVGVSLVSQGWDLDLEQKPSFGVLPYLALGLGREDRGSQKLKGGTVVAKGATTSLIK